MDIILNHYKACQWD